MLATLLDRSEGTALPLSASLRERYGGDLRFPTDRTHVFANFVSSIDGVVSFARPGQAQAGLISGGNPADRFVLALLRAAADAVVVGAGTLRQERNSIWTAEHVFPDLARDFADLRVAMRKPARPPTIFVTASGELDLTAPALAEGAPVAILTTANGEERLGSVPGHVRVRALADLSARAIVRAAGEESGGRLILTEGGPTLLGSFLREGVLDELFLTIAPRIAGRSREERRLALVEGAAFAPADAPERRVVGVKAAGNYLFLRFARN